MILTNTVKVPFFVPQGTTLVRALVWTTKESEENGVRTIKVVSSEQIVNLSLVSALIPCKLHSTTEKREYLSDADKYKATRYDEQRKPFRYVEVSRSEAVEVFTVTKIHSDVQFPSYWISFPETKG